MENKNGAPHEVVNFLGLLQLLFIGLRLTGYILWNWWWVLAPLWMPTAVLLVAGAIVTIAQRKK